LLVLYIPSSILLNEFSTNFFIILLFEEKNLLV
jgi:hypothetical protein